ncbi:MAG: LptF/LptG family permease, partial [Bacteroidota bacterium]
AEIFQDKYEMLNVFQIGHATDSLDQRKKFISHQFIQSIKGSFPTFQTIVPANISKQLNNDPMLDTKASSILPFDSLGPLEKRQLQQDVITKLYQINENIRNHENFIVSMDHENAQFWIEFHRKFSLTYSIIVLFFVGAPLGAVVRKGGFGAPVVIAALLFMFYFIIYSIGDNLADTYVVEPWLGMWMPGIFFTPLAVVVTYMANNDRKIELPKIKWWTLRK